MTAFTRGTLPFVVKASVGTADASADIRVSTDGTTHIGTADITTLIGTVVSATTPGTAVTASAYVPFQDGSGNTFYLLANLSVW